VPGFGDHFTAVGQGNADGRDRFALARYDRRGKLDPSFGDMGSVVVPTSAPYAYGAAGAQLPDGRVVAVGASGDNTATESLRFSGTVVDAGGAAAAAVDPPGRGRRTRTPTPSSRWPTGAVLSAGVATERLGNPAMALMRTSPTGVLDRTWDGDGLATARAGDGTVASDVVLDAEGARWRPATRRSAPTRVRGRALRRRRRARPQLRRRRRAHDVPGTSRARATAIARQPDGKLVVAGIACSSGSGAQCSGGTARLALARYLVAPSAAPPPGRRHAASGHQAGVRHAARAADRPPRRGAGARRCVQAKRCKGKLSLRRLRKGHKALLLGSKRATVKARRTRTIVVKVRPQAARPPRKSRARIEFAGRDASGARRKITRRVTLKRR
jgi:uncharacterized delta-60 repeat protein